MEKNKTHDLMVSTSILATTIFIINYYLYTKTSYSIYFRVFIISLCTSYHLVMRLLIEAYLDYKKSMTFDYTNAYFKEKKLEKKLWSLLKIKKWKNIVPTYIPSNFDLKCNSLASIIQNMCFAEISHLMMFVASYVPILFSFMTSEYQHDIWIFFITSFILSLFDLLFVILQRYNRPRVIAIMKRTDKYL